MWARGLDVRLPCVSTGLVVACRALAWTVGGPGVRSGRWGDLRGRSQGPSPCKVWALNMCPRGSRGDSWHVGRAGRLRGGGGPSGPRWARGGESHLVLVGNFGIPDGSVVWSRYHLEGGAGAWWFGHGLQPVDWPVGVLGAYSGSGRAWWFGRYPTCPPDALCHGSGDCRSVFAAAPPRTLSDQVSVRVWRSGCITM